MNNDILDQNLYPTFENQHIRLWIKDGIVFGLYKQGAIVTLDVAKDIVKNRLLLQQGKEYPLLTFLSYEMKVLTPDARKFLAKEGYEGVTKFAAVTTSKLKIFMVNIFITVEKPVKPSKLFGTEKEAIDWLKNEV